MKKLLTVSDLPTLTRSQVRENYKKYMNPGFATLLGLLDFDKLYVKAEGAYVWDADGNRYLDFLGGYGSLNIGHNNSHVIEAVRRAETMPNLLQASINAAAGALAYNLAQITPGKLQNTFFCNSGAEAVEGALKIARIATGRPRIISCKSGFHGKTMGSLSGNGPGKIPERL